MRHYIHLWSVVAIGLLISGIMWLACEPHTANAHHDRIYTPCDTTTGHVHMSYEEVVARISIMEQEGTIPAGMISRYEEARDGGKGKQDPRFVWARNLEEGQILSLGNWASGEHFELEQLMFNSGMVAEWQLDATKTVRRFNDPYWIQANPLSPSFTVWATLCMANLGYSIPLFEEVEGEWVSNIPEVQQWTTTTTIPTTTTTTPVAVVEVAAPEPPPVLTPVHEKLSSSWVERWFQAEWDDFPFETTIKLLEERFPPETVNKKHFRLSVAVQFLREGGKLKGLDNVWNN